MHRWHLLYYRNLTFFIVMTFMYFCISSFFLSTFLGGSHRYFDPSHGRSRSRCRLKHKHIRDEQYFRQINHLTFFPYVLTHNPTPNQTCFLFCLKSKALVLLVWNSLTNNIYSPCVNSSNIVRLETRKYACERTQRFVPPKELMDCKASKVGLTPWLLIPFGIICPLQT